MNLSRRCGRAVVLAGLFSLALYSAGCQTTPYGPSPETMERIANNVISTSQPLNATCSVLAFDNQYVPDVGVADYWGESFNHTQVGAQLQRIVADYLARSNFFQTVTLNNPGADVVISGYVQKMEITGDYGAGCTYEESVYYKAAFPGLPGLADVTDTVYQRAFCPGKPATYGQAMNLVLMQTGERLVNGFFSSESFARLKQKRASAP